MEQVWCGASLTIQLETTHRGVVIDREAVNGGARGLGQLVYFCDPFGNKIEVKGTPEHPDG